MFFFLPFSRDNETNGTVKYDIVFSKTSWDVFFFCLLYFCVYFKFSLKPTKFVWESVKRVDLEYNLITLKLSLKVFFNWKNIKNSHICFLSLL